MGPFHDRLTQMASISCLDINSSKLLSLTFLYEKKENLKAQVVHSE